MACGLICTLIWAGASFTNWIMAVFVCISVQSCDCMYIHIHPLVYVHTHTQKEAYFYKFESKEKGLMGWRVVCSWWEPSLWSGAGKKSKDAGNCHCFLPVVSWAVDRSTPQAVSLPVVAAKQKHSHQGQTVGECWKSLGSWGCSPPVLAGNRHFSCRPGLSGWAEPACVALLYRASHGNGWSAEEKNF